MIIAASLQVDLVCHGMTEVVPGTDGSDPYEVSVQISSSGSDLDHNMWQRSTLAFGGCFWKRMCEWLSNGCHFCEVLTWVTKCKAFGQGHFFFSGLTIVVVYCYLFCHMRHIQVKCLYESIQV